MCGAFCAVLSNCCSPPATFPPAHTPFSLRPPIFLILFSSISPLIQQQGCFQMTAWAAQEKEINPKACASDPSHSSSSFLPYTETFISPKNSPLSQEQLVMFVLGKTNNSSHHARGWFSRKFSFKIHSKKQHLSEEKERGKKVQKLSHVA